MENLRRLDTAELTDGEGRGCILRLYRAEEVALVPVGSSGGGLSLAASGGVEVAERIAQAENRIGKLRVRVERFKDEGSDATQAEELLNSVAATLGHLYAHQSDLRRSAWVISK